MEKQYEQLKLEILFFCDVDVLTASGDGYEEDPWGDGTFGGAQ